MEQRTYYDPSNGRIITSVKGSIEYLDLSQYEQYPYIEQFTDSLTQYVENGVLIDMPEKPHPESIFDYNTKQWQDLSIDVVKKNIKIQRDAALISSDWTQLGDVPLVNKELWAIYRQALRDIPTQSGYPFNVVWPTQPE